jgi:CPA2 family monovalent cation:H+ antiporter-2
MGIAGDIAMILVACLFCALLAQRLGFPLILGYIVGGVLLSPNTVGPSVGSLHEIELLADIGVALLLFTVGLEFPAEQLRPVRNVALFGAPLQMLAVGGFGYLLGRLVGWDPQQSIWFGALITVSSTMVVLKVLMSRGLMETLSSKVMLGILVVQDIAVIPMILLLPQLGNLREGMAVLGVAMVRAALLVTFMLLVGTRALPWLLRRVVAWESRELFIIVVLGIGLGVGYATYLVGLSFAFGAFLAGIVLSRSEHSHDALSDMIPLREVFSLLFFASVGLILSPSYLLSHLGMVVGLVLAVMLGKGVLMALITRAFGYKRIIPLAIGLAMPQVGEFAFVLARTGRTSGTLGEDVYYLVISVAVITMALTPFSAGPTYRLYRWWQGLSEEPVPEEEGCPKAAGRPVLIGYGHQGRFIAGLLSEIGHPPVVLDFDFERAQAARREGRDSLCAEATSDEAVARVGVAEATLIIVSISDRVTSLQVVEKLKALDGPPVVVVALTVQHLEELHALGVDQAVLAPLETGLEMVHQALLRLSYDPLKAHGIVDAVRRNRYRLGVTASLPVAAAGDAEGHSGAAESGQSLGEAPRQRHDAHGDELDTPERSSQQPLDDES